MAVISGRGRNAAVRTISRNGHSLTVGIPRVMLYALKLNLGDYLLLRLVRGDGFFTVRRAGSETFIPAARGERGAMVISYRKVQKAGNSRVITLPTEFRSELNLFEKDELLLVLDRSDGSFTVRPWQAHTIGPAKRTELHNVAEVSS